MKVRYLPPQPRPSGAVVLAAGKGTRLKSSTAKVLHQVAGRSLLRWVLEALRSLALDQVVVVVGHEGDQVRAEAEAAELPNLSCVEQVEQRGTGHAVRVAIESGLLADVAALLVVPGDVPGIGAETLHRLLAARGDEAAALLTTRLADPTGYGRILRDADGVLTGIIEHRDANAAQQSIDEVNTSLYAFERAALEAALKGITNANAQGEEYLTDAIALLEPGAAVGLEVHPDEVRGVNDRAELADVAAMVRRRILVEHMRNGVSITDPGSTHVDADVHLEPDATLLPGTMLHGATMVATGAVVGPYSRLTDTQVSEGAEVAFTVATGAVIGPHAQVGPYTYLRPGTVLGPRSKAGGFVEMKAAVIGEGSKVPHLSYIGDADIGAGVNVGAGSVTVNYDGFDKHHTTIGDGAFIGSDTMLVAPVEVGPGAVIGAGSTITEDVPADALALERANMRIIDGWAERRRARHAEED